MAMSGEVDALWLLTPNDTRLDIMREIHRCDEGRRAAARGGLRKAARPHARRGARNARLVEDAGLLHGYLENQLFSTAVMRGKDIIWRRAVPRADGPIWRVRPRNIPARTSPGSGKAKGKAVACSPT